MLKKISITDLRLGMFIQEFCGSWINHPFMRNKFLLKNIDDLQRIRASSVTQVIIDTDKGLDVESNEADSKMLKPTSQSVDVPSLSSPRTKRIAVDLEQEVARAVQLCARSKQAVIKMFTDARMGKAIETEQANELVQEITESVLRHPSALISLARLKNADEYTYMHSVAVCALMIALARELKLEEALIRDAGLAGLLHDIGKMAIDEKILNKPGKLTDEEFTAVKRHPEAGYEMLQEVASVTDLTKYVCLHHHEKYDGSGYPHRLSGDAIHLLGRMGAVCDVYDAITSDRPYKKGWDPAEAIGRMAEWKGHFDPLVFQAFVKAIGIYPVGALVRLQSQRLAIVIDQNAGTLLTPKVKVFFSVKSNVPIEQEIIDLAKTKGTEKIVAREPLENWNFPNLHELWSGTASTVW